MGLRDLFSGTPKAPATKHVGGCSVHEVRGPVRSSAKAADKDAQRHGERMHGSKTFYGGYIERRG